MTRNTARVLLWAPRILGLLVCAFIGMFALDALEEGRSFIESLPAFAMHLIPSAVLLIVVLASWRWEWVGGLTFIGLGTAYALNVGARHPDWVLVISGPLLVVGVFFLWSWWHHRELHETLQGRGA